MKSSVQKSSTATNYPLFSSRKEKDCSTCTHMLLDTLTKTSRVSKILSVMNAQVFSNYETGEIGIQINDDTNKLNSRVNESKSYTTEIPIQNSNMSSNSNRTVIPVLPVTSTARISSITTSTVATSIRTDPSSSGPSHLANSSSSRATPVIPPPIQIQCAWCSNHGPEGGARAFVKGPEPLSMVLCANRLSTADEIEEVLVHELIHIYDVKFRGIDLRECTELAYSEIKAAREAECFKTPSLFRNLCIKNKAITATNNMFPNKGKHCVNRMFDRAMKDIHPISQCLNENKEKSVVNNKQNNNNSNSRSQSGSDTDRENYISPIFSSER